MTTDNRYNGWTNYETWNLALWIDNEMGSQTYWRERAIETYAHATANDTFTREDSAALDLAEELKDSIEQDAPELEPSFYSDMLNAGISEVNWYEIARNWIDDVVDESTEGAS